MTFTGTYPRTLDDKNRVSVPKGFRDGLIIDEVREVFLAPESEHSVALYPRNRFHERAQELLTPSETQPSKTYQRLYYAQAEGIEIDKQGRIRLPDRLIEHAQIQTEIVLLGVNDHIEIWDQTRWSNYLKNNLETFDDLNS